MLEHVVHAVYIGRSALSSILLGALSLHPLQGAFLLATATLLLWVCFAVIDHMIACQHTQ